MDIEYDKTALARLQQMCGPKFACILQQWREQFVDRRLVVVLVAEMLWALVDIGHGALQITRHDFEASQANTLLFSFRFHYETYVCTSLPVRDEVAKRPMKGTRGRYPPRLD